MGDLMRFLNWFSTAPRTFERQEPHLSIASVHKTVFNSISRFPYTMAFGGIPSATNMPVTPTTAMQATAVYGCVKVLSEDIAKLPLKVMTRDETGSWEESHTHPLVNLLRKPFQWMTAFPFWRFVMESLTLRGNAYILISRDSSGRPAGLLPLPPDGVTVRLNDDTGEKFYNVSHRLVGSIIVHEADIIHIMGHSLDGLIGLSPIQSCPEAIGLALATQRHGAKLFGQGTQIQGVLQTPGTISKEAAERLAQSWRDSYAGVENANKIAVLEQGMTYEKIGMTSEDAQFLETRQFQIVDICRIFRVPPHKIQHLAEAHFNTLEQQNQSYVEDALIPYLVQIQQALADKLLFKREYGCIRFDFAYDAMLRGDMKTRYEAHQRAIMSGLKSPNECRAMEGLPPYDGGDIFTRPLNTGDITGGDNLTGAKPPSIGLDDDKSISTPDDF